MVRAQKKQCKRSYWAQLSTKRTLLLIGHQKLVLAGCFSGSGEDIAWLLQPGELSAECLENYSTAGEADNRMW